MAVVGFSMTIAAFLGFAVPLLFFLLIPGLIVCSVAVSRAKRYPEVYGGKDLASAGIVISLIGIIAIVAVTIAFVISYG